MYNWLNRIIFILIILSFPSFAFGYPTAKVTAKVVTEHDVPISGAEVWVSFMVAKKGGWGMDTKQIRGNTNNEGIFQSQGNGTNSISVSARKEGYYPSGVGYKFTSKSKLLNRWKPWNPTIEVVLKKKRNPVPMYMKGTNWATILSLDSPVGYDLMKGDWVAPHGRGVINDLVVNFSSDYKAYRDYKSVLTITFPNGKDGIQEYVFKQDDQSLYKWPFEAPEEGYIKKIVKFKSDRPGKGIHSNDKEKINYIFRVRTKVDKAGNLVEGKYGKIDGDFRVGRKPKFNMGYYLNPDGTRNIEEDPEKNLFPERRR